MQSRIVLPAAVVLFHFLCSSPLESAETWTWFRSVTTGTEWWTTKGQGDVDFSSGKFSATLHDGEDNSVRLSLTGSVSDGVVQARVTVLDTDDPPFRLSGRLKRFCWSKGGGREVLILTDRAEVIGLFRELTPSRACKPTP
jgi:hypothetical protein